MKTLSEADYVERKDLYASPLLVRRIGDSSMSSTTLPQLMTRILKKLVETAFRVNSKNKVVLGGHSACGIVTHRFVTSGIVDQSWIDAYIFVVISSGAPFGGAPMAFGSSASPRKWMFPWFGESTINILTQDCGCLHWMIPSKNTFDDNYVVGQLKILSSSLQHILPSPTLLSHLSACKGDIMRNITMKNRTWTFDQEVRPPLVKPKVMTHVMYSIGVTTTAGVILNATNPRRWSDTHSDYYVDGDGTVPIVSLSVLRKWRDTSLVEFHTYRGCDHMGIITDAVPIGHILDITAPETAANMEDEDSLNPPDDF
ncbi:hypothetical protein BLNAU_24190 [Blattamonas nauphoetae]|uniref:Uncharacterized protein n=1 Tax=Blattamonas nauphoetae TaxID=2049346 RepID=A0ABQ9WN59_9EUKA|nr:hypothetical protein BLNAU_24190 [Blattamonas nauphoetae]